MFGFIKHLLYPNVAIMAEDQLNETLNQLTRAVVKAL